MNKTTEQLLTELNTMQTNHIKVLNERIEVLTHTIEIDKITIQTQEKTIKLYLDTVKNLTETEKEIILTLIIKAIEDIGLGEIEYLKPLQTIKNKLK